MNPGKTDPSWHPVEHRKPCKFYVPWRNWRFDVSTKRWKRAALASGSEHVSCPAPSRFPKERSHPSARLGLVEFPKSGVLMALQSPHFNRPMVERAQDYL